MSIAAEHPGARVWATDIAGEAVELARANAARLAPDVVVVQGDLLAPSPPELRGIVDLVVCNPPYLAPHAVEGLAEEVRAEPILALVGGLDLYERLASEARTWLAPGGALIVEIEETTAPAVRRALEAAGYGDTSVRPDLSGRARVVFARWP